MITLGHPPDEEASGLLADIAHDLTLHDIERLAAIFPGVPPRQAAVALLRDAIETAEFVNGEGQ